MKKLLLLFVISTAMFSSLQSQTDKNGWKLSNSDVYKVVDEQPLFYGCDPNLEFEERKKCAAEKMLDFIAENLDYPAEALENEIEGKVYVKFVVELDGSITDIEVVRDLGYGTKEEVIRMIESMPLWEPGKVEGEIVRSQFNLPVLFSLSPKPKKKGRN